MPDVVEVIAPGAQSSLQELPGRIGLWHVGVPPSGPMDDYSFRHANRLVGNAGETAALELTVSGPVLKFFSDVTVALIRRDDANGARWRTGGAQCRHFRQSRTDA